MEKLIVVAEDNNNILAHNVPIGLENAIILVYLQDKIVGSVQNIDGWFWLETFIDQEEFSKLDRLMKEYDKYTYKYITNDL